MKNLTEPNNYRNELVQQIKDAGQELIDRAEDMVSENTDMITDFNIHISFAQENYPLITFETEVFPKNHNKEISILIRKFYTSLYETENLF